MILTDIPDLCELCDQAEIRVKSARTIEEWRERRRVYRRCVSMLARAVLRASGVKVR